MYSVDFQNCSVNNNECCWPTFNQICENDYPVYQLCGFIDSLKCANPNLDPIRLLCGNYICNVSSSDSEDSIITVPQVNTSITHSCITHPSCQGSEQNYCDSKTSFKCKENTGEVVSELGKCDGLWDCSSGTDEVGCKHPYGMECESSTNVKIWASDKQICDGNEDCKDGRDENKTICQSFKKGDVHCNMLPSELAKSAPDRVCLHFVNKERGDIPPCLNGHDQMNCDNDSLLWCDVTMPAYGSMTEEVVEYTAISKTLLCDGIKHCDNGLDEECKFLDHKCYIHKHLLCDNHDDCPNGQDERDFHCTDVELTTTATTCKRKLQIRTEQIRFPHLWLCDGVEDCEDGKDEQRTNWQICQHPGGETEWLSDHKECVEDTASCVTWFICPSHDGKVLPVEAVCNGMLHTECPTEQNICSATKSIEAKKDIEHWKTKHSNTEAKKFVSYCLPGLEKFGHFHCIREAFTFYKDVFGVSEDIFLIPKEMQDCRYFYGEEYVFLACDNRCKAADTICPLLHHAVSSTDCKVKKDIEHAYIKSPSLAGGLSYVKHQKYDSEVYESDLFACDNGNCVQIKQVCDLTNNCGDWSDERNCSNAFKCESSLNRISWDSVCDGTYDCADFSDECNSSCSKRLITGVLLCVIAWSFGIIALTMNSAVIFKSLRKCKKVRSNTSLVNHIFLVLIASGDVFISLHLVGIAIANTSFDDNYCKQKYKWRLSWYCSMLGTFQVVGCQMSLFNMLILAMYRGYITKFPTKPSSSYRNIVFKILIAWIVVLICSFTIAVLPVSGVLQDFFVNGYYHENLTNLMLGVPNKFKHLQILSAYHGKINRKLSWRRILKLIDNMFILPEGKNFTHKILSFYGSNSVCLFKYFVTWQDSQRFYILTVLLINISCTVFICVSYLLIIIVSSSLYNKKDGGGAIKKRRRRQQAMIRRISMIIVVGMITWIPIAFVCFLHYLETVDADDYYEVFGILGFPLATVIHPLICEKTLRDSIRRIIQRIPGLSKLNGKVGVKSWLNTTSVTGQTTNVFSNTAVNANNGRSIRCCQTRSTALESSAEETSDSVREQPRRRTLPTHMECNEIRKTPAKP